MGYLNPILAYGAPRFCSDAAQAGADGLIVVDLPQEEADLLLPDAARHGLDIIRLVTPTTDDARLRQVLAGSSGFLYYVCITGITGTQGFGRGPVPPPSRASATPPTCRSRSVSASNPRAGRRAPCASPTPRWWPPP